MSRAQQRTSAIRRIGQNPFGNQYPTFDWVWSAIVGLNVDYELIGPNNLPYPSLDGFTLNGVPQILGTSPANQPTLASFVGGKLRLQYTTTPQEGDDVFLLPNDTALRDPFGAYLTSKSLRLGPGLPNPVDTTLSNAVIDGADLLVDYDNLGGRLFIGDTALITNTTLSVQPISVAISPSQLRARFAVGPNSGDQIQFQALGGGWLNETLGEINGVTLTVA